MVSSDRIQDNLRQLASIGATPEGGATRLAWSPEERQAHELAKQWMRDAGLEVWEDPLGNTFGRRRGQDDSLPTIMIGSHLDTVNNGGNLDGTLGFVAAMETVRSLNEEGRITRHPITVAVFAAEEAVRFADTCMGSKLITSQMERAELDQLKDAQGTTPAQAMREIGLDPDRIDEIRWDPASIAAYLEIHIEQGLVLEKLGKKVGVVTAIAAATRYKVILEGSADHSGATPMGARKDALAAAAEIVLGVERIASEEAGPTTVGTVGILKVKPGAMTVIPGWAELGIDIRDTVPEDKRTASTKTEAMIREVCERRNIGLTLEQLIDHAPAKMDDTVQASMRGAAEELGHDYHVMPSAAGHDARIMAFVTRAGLLFVPSRDGISHSPKEYTAPEDVLAGIEVMAEATRQLDESL
jgi:beta-ureidopropionase / N-carbamoyl-L-amino-acid hydrolase